MVSIRTGDGVKFTPREDKIDDDRPTSPKASKPKSPVVRKTQAAAAAERRSEAHVKRGPKKRQRKHPPYLPQGSMDSVLNLTAVKVKTDKDTDYSKMRVKHLKSILAERGVTCNGCLEKSDYVKKAKETAHMDL